MRFETAPIYNALCSMCLLSQDHLDTISDWVDFTKQHLTDAERMMSEDACNTVPYVETAGASDMDTLLENLSKTDPAVIRRQALERLREKAVRYAKLADVPDIETIGADREMFLDLVERIMTCKGHESMFNREEEDLFFTQLNDGPAYRDRLVGAVRQLWEKHVRVEWPRVMPSVEASVEAFESIEIPGDSFTEQLLFITERDSLPEEWLEPLDEAREVVFIPSVHIGPFMIMLHHDDQAVYIVGRARIPEGSPVHEAGLDRSDLLIRLEALSDASRLRVLELASERGVVTTGDVMEELDLSQSSASRHLTQLTATGLLSVDASERTKRYSVNASRVDQVFSGLKTLLGAKTGV